MTNEYDLTYEQCVALRSAGYPQPGHMYRTMFGWEVDGEGAQPILRWRVFPKTMYSGYHFITCPRDSDEVMAALHERFDATDIQIEKAGAQWCASMLPCQGQGPTLLQALCALYIDRADPCSYLAIIAEATGDGDE